MKKIKFLLILVMTLNFLNSKSQTDSVIENKFKNLEEKFLNFENQNEILKKNLDKCHKQWVDGLGITTFGLGVSVLGVAIVNQSSNNPSWKDDGVGIKIGIAGGVFTLIGSIIMIDSHKFIGRAGLGINQKGIYYKF